jgi:biotin carboxylase
VLGVLEEATDDVTTALSAAEELGFPVVVKAVDGGGVRGIRVVPTSDVFSDAFRRCVNESVSRQVFVEKAVRAGARHVEAQIAGILTGSVWHETRYPESSRQKPEPAEPRVATRRDISGLF